MNRTLSPQLTNRVLAYGIDMGTYLVFPLALLPLGLALRDKPMSTTTLVAVSAIPPAAAAVTAAWQESGRHRATLGKRSRALLVRDDTAPEPGNEALPFPRALLRNAVKVFVPWQLGHITTITGLRGGFVANDPVTLTSCGLTYLVIGWLGLSVALGDGRGLHDRIAGSRVVGRART